MSALNKIPELLHVSAPECYPQRVYYNKGILKFQIT